MKEPFRISPVGIRNNEKQLLYNAYQTPDGTILHSKSRHDYVSHKDKNGKTYAVDGGLAYSRVVGDFQDLKSLCVYDDGTHETRRKYLYWGRNYNAKRKLLPETEWIPIKDLDTDHISNILEEVISIDPLYRKTLTEELSRRKMK